MGRMGHTAEAIHKRQRANRLRQSGGITGSTLADALEREATALLAPAVPFQTSHSEIVPAGNDGLAPYLRDTLEHPDILAAEASEARMQLAADAGVLEMAADAAETIQPKNSLERMLAHELAGAHCGAMKLLNRALDPAHPPVEAARLANASARLMDAFREGFLALNRVRTGGRQLLTVQHISVTEGGQAVVAGNIGPRKVDSNA